MTKENFILSINNNDIHNLFVKLGQTHFIYPYFHETFNFKTRNSVQLLNLTILVFCTSKYKLYDNIQERKICYRYSFLIQNHNSVRTGSVGKILVFFHKKINPVQTIRIKNFYKRNTGTKEIRGLENFRIRTISASLCSA